MGQIIIYNLSEWAAPFGIILVLDQLSALMLVLTYSLALPLLWFSSKKWDERGRYFHTMVHFLLMGLCGAFLTGDLFNLFVFFEILLLASYVLLLHGQGKARFQLGYSLRHHQPISLCPVPNWFRDDLRQCRQFKHDRCGASNSATRC